MLRAPHPIGHSLSLRTHVNSEPARLCLAGADGVAEVGALAGRLADAVGVRRIGTPFDPREAVSNLKTYGEGSLLVWFLEDYREDVVLVVRVQHLGIIGGCYGGRPMLRDIPQYAPGKYARAPSGRAVVMSVGAASVGA